MKLLSLNEKVDILGNNMNLITYVVGLITSFKLVELLKLCGWLFDL